MVRVSIGVILGIWTAGSSTGLSHRIQVTGAPIAVEAVGPGHTDSIARIPRNIREAALRLRAATKRLSREWPELWGPDQAFAFILRDQGRVIAVAGRPPSPAFAPIAGSAGSPLLRGRLYAATLITDDRDFLTARKVDPFALGLPYAEAPSDTSEAPA
ncbi:MAG TPA: hypothetical protein VGP87_12215, partial [Gemmatimonadales bacterium]|nr:hypothetical protein [Gemmatimonadales bacterium]